MQNTKKAIPERIRKQVWREYIGKLRGMGLCFCCAEKIYWTHWDCGHVVAEAKGGATEPRNLRPVCSECNGHMATVDMREYAAQLNRWPEGKLPTKEVYLERLIPAFHKELNSEEKAVQARPARPIVPKKPRLDEKKTIATFDKQLSTLTSGDVRVFEQKGDDLLAFLDTCGPCPYSDEIDAKRVDLIRRATERDIFAAGGSDWRYSPIYVAIVPFGKKLVRILLDGSHRKEALRRTEGRDKVAALLLVVRLHTQDQLSRVFYWNKCGTGAPNAFYLEAVREVADPFINKISLQFPGRESYRDSAQKPNFVRKDVIAAFAASAPLRDYFAAGLIEAQAITPVFEAFLLQQKREFESLRPSHRLKVLDISQKMCDTIVASGFYIGAKSGKVWAPMLAEDIMADIDAREALAAATNAEG